MREESIVIYPFEEVKITKYQGMYQVNEHAYVRLSGEIPFNRKDEYMELGKTQQWVKIKAVMQQRECNLFYGVLVEFREEIKGGVCTVEMLLESGTILMDFKEKTRSFQSGSLTYGEVLDICNQGYESVKKFMTVAQEKSIERFIMQHHETDWKYVKRLASMNHTVVMPECHTKGVKYYFGLPDRRDIIPKDDIEYSTYYDMQEYWRKKEGGLDIEPSDVVSYIFESREIYRLGDCGIIDGRRLFIWKIITELKGNLLYHTYYMQPKRGFQMPEQYNSNISGTSLQGIVKKVNGEEVQVELFNDENKSNTGVRWFLYSTVYSSKDGTGWYCMPEIGDKIRLYFPTEKEQEAYVISAYHEGNANLRKNPKIKFWRNREGKEIQLAPEKIFITNNKGTYIELSDKDGISIVSGGAITLSAGEVLRMSSRNSSIEMNASNRVRLRQGETEMSLGGDLTMSGAQIRL